MELGGRHTILLLVFLLSCFVTPISFAGTPPREINADMKDDPIGFIHLNVSGVCGQDYWLVSPSNSDFWEINIHLESEMKDQPIHVTIYEVIGEYPYNYQEQVDAPTANSIGSVTLNTSLDPSKKYEIWIRDGYAKPFTGAIEESWYSLDSLSAYDYLFFQPGHYTTFQASHGTNLNFEKELEMVYQNATDNHMFVTLDFLDREGHGSSILGDVNGDNVILNHGYPSRNEHNYWFLLSLPISFADGDTWNWNEAESLVTYIGKRTVNGMVFDDVVKVSIDSTQVNYEFTRGKGEVYYARNVGIIEWEFRKASGEVFNLKIQEYGELPPINVSGRL